jgi:hypothetical protein
LIIVLKQRVDKAFKLFTCSIGNALPKQAFINVFKRFQEFHKSYTSFEPKGNAERKAEDQILDFIISLSDKLLSRSYINTRFSGIKRFYEVNGLVLEI